MFFDGDYSSINRRGKLPFSAALLQGWVAALRQRHERLAALGVRYLYVVGPDKESVYPEYLPDARRPAGTTRLDQLLERLARDAPDIEVLDLRGPLIALKQFDQEQDWIYYPRGTHWSARGSQLALELILERLEKMGLNFSPRALDGYVRSELPGQGDSLARGMYLSDVIVENASRYSPPIVRARVMPTGPNGPGRVRIATIEGSELPRVLLRHDSFGLSIESALGEQCSFLQGSWGRDLNMPEVTELKPDVVIDLFVERMLNYARPSESVPLEEAPWRARFEHSNKVLVKLDRSRSDWGLQEVGGLEIGPLRTGNPPKLRLTVRKYSNKLGLPALVRVEGEIPVLYVVLESLKTDQLTLFSRQPGAERFLRRVQYKVAINPGLNELYLPLTRPETSGDLLLQLGETPARFWLHKLEIRSVAP
jgi:hypothetical protein